ncbi:hypothetical protein IC582_025374 [Cucumis melo]
MRSRSVICLVGWSHAFNWLNRGSIMLFSNFKLLHFFTFYFNPSNVYDKCVMFLFIGN